MQAGLVHAARHSSWVAIDAGNEGMSELLIGGTVVERLEDDGLAASVPSSEDEHDLSCFHNLAHDLKNLRKKKNKTFSLQLSAMEFTFNGRKVYGMASSYGGNKGENPHRNPSCSGGNVYFVLSNVSSSADPRRRNFYFKQQQKSTLFPPIGHHSGL